MEARHHSGSRPVRHTVPTLANHKGDSMTTIMSDTSGSAFSLALLGPATLQLDSSVSVDVW